MENETEAQPMHDEKPLSFGARLKEEREKLGLSLSVVAEQLRLPEKIIIMIEKERYSADLPLTFIRGYLKSYGKYLEIPDFEINKALEAIKPTESPANIIPFSSRSLVPISKKRDYIQIVTYVVFFSLTGLLSFWGYNYYAKSPTSLIEKATVLLENKKPLIEKIENSFRNRVKEKEIKNFATNDRSNSFAERDPYADNL